MINIAGISSYLLFVFLVYFLEPNVGIKPNKIKLKVTIFMAIFYGLSIYLCEGNILFK